MRTQRHSRHESKPSRTQAKSDTGNMTNPTKVKTTKRREEGRRSKQYIIYYLPRALQGVKARYLSIKKLALAIIAVAHILRM